MTIRFVPRCQFCGKVGASMSGDSRGNAPRSTPHIPGSCPASPRGVHAPQWEPQN
ncbi:MAG: hypothetical protein SOU50_01295 [Oscillospiraceae bacterium]|nr:hypothetical protein [Oscillospiraceae bacterium]MDY2846838.1 hypothetical protein [Oscillospiraceae bacterium]